MTLLINTENFENPENIENTENMEKKYSKSKVLVEKKNQILYSVCYLEK